MAERTAQDNWQAGTVWLDCLALCAFAMTRCRWLAPPVHAVVLPLVRSGCTRQARQREELFRPSWAAPQPCCAAAAHIPSSMHAASARRTVYVEARPGAKVPAARMGHKTSRMGHKEESLMMLSSTAISCKVRLHLAADEQDRMRPVTAALPTAMHPRRPPPACPTCHPRPVVRGRKRWEVTSW